MSTKVVAFIIEGKGLKSYNQWWNQQKTRLQAIYAKQGIQCGKKLAKLLQKRQSVVCNYMVQVVHWLIQECLRQKLGTLVIGELEAIKQHLNLGRKTNQYIQCILFGLFKQKLQSKCEYYGIRFVEVEKAYTFQPCSNCGIRLKKFRKYRGLYACSRCDMIRNADVNGALNILQVASESMRIRNRGRVDRPV